MAAAKSQLNKLYGQYGGRCHYCNCKTQRATSGNATKGNIATRDHVVPKYMGGANAMENYVLACHKCNSRRGNQLFYCDCMHCAPMIREALNNQKNIDKVFYALVDFNKPRIKVVPDHPAAHIKGKFIVKVGHSLTKHFFSFEEAVDYALNAEHAKRKAYK